MKIIGLSVRILPSGGQEVTTIGHLEKGEELTADDMARLSEQLAEAGQTSGAPVTNMAGASLSRRRAATATTEPDPAPPTADAAAANTGRRRSAGASTSPPAETAAPVRRRRVVTTAASTSETAAPQEDASAPSASTGRRRRVVEPQLAEVSVGDLVKASSQAAASLHALGYDGPETVMVILKEDFGVASADKLEPGQRQAFIDALLKEVSEAEAEAAKS